MSYPPSINRDDARQVVADRIARASERRMPATTRRRGLSRRRRDVAGGLDV